ncbi:MAG: hypothetical protein Q9162_006966 [Coniocarpon cinnabarinum]
MAEAVALNVRRLPISTIKEQALNNSIQTIPSALPLGVLSPPTPIISRLPPIISERENNASAIDAPLQVTYTTCHLPSIDPASLALWHALHNLNPTPVALKDLPTHHYPAPSPTNASHSQPHHSLRPPPTTSDSPIAANSLTAAFVSQLFNWSDLHLPANLSEKFYGVLFLSRRKSDSNSERLYKADRAAHEEAVASGGLLMYYYGVPDGEGRNIATCIWSDAESARRASKLARHREAVGLATGAYEWFELRRYGVLKVEGETGVRIVDL